MSQIIHLRSPRQMIDSDTLLQLSCDGTNGATTFPDDRGVHTVTANGNAQVSTAQKKFGTGSLLLDGTGDFLSIPDSADWTPGTNYTIEMWLRLDAATGRREIIGHRQDGSNYWALIFDFTGSSGIRFVQRAGNTTTISIDQGANTGWSADTWYHVAMIKTGNVYTIARDGVSVVTDTDATGMNDLTGQLEIGGDVSADDFLTSPFDGFMDEIRLSQVARYTAPFSPPTQAFADG